jgi:hypothetical protein
MPNPHRISSFLSVFPAPFNIGCIVTVQPVLDRITGLTGNFFHPVDLSVLILDLRLQILLNFLNHDEMSWAFVFSYPVSICRILKANIFQI